MRTQQNNKVKAIVDKYKKLASETEDRKRALMNFTEKRHTSGKYAYESKDDDYEFKDLEYYAKHNTLRDEWSLHFEEQLIGRIYQLRAGDLGNPDVIKRYEIYTSLYICGLLSQDEEQFLVANFDLFVDCVMDHLHTDRLTYKDAPTHNGFKETHNWIQIVPHLLRNTSLHIFLPCSNDGEEMLILKKHEITIGSGFYNASIRALAHSISFHEYHTQDSDSPLWSDIKDEQFDAIIVEFDDFHSDDEPSTEECFKSAWRIVKNGGDIFFCVSSSYVLSNDSFFLRNKIVKDKSLSKAILLPSGMILFHIIKKQQTTFVMCDATSLFLGTTKIVDADALVKRLRESDLSKDKGNHIARSFSYEKLHEDIFLPQYYLRFPKSGIPMENLFRIETEVISPDKCCQSEKVATVINTSSIFSNGNFKIKELPFVRHKHLYDDTKVYKHLRGYYRTKGPAVIMAISSKEIRVGYTTDTDSFLVAKNLYVLKPQKGIDVKYIACVLLSSNTKEMLKTLTYTAHRLTSGWSKLIFVELHSPKKQQIFIQETILNDYVAQEKFINLQEKSFKQAIRLRKHALSQNISAFDSMFSSLEYCMQENKGVLKANTLISPVSQLTVADAMNILSSDLKIICKKIAHLTDEQDWGPCEAIEPQQFIVNYEQSHKNSSFAFSHEWDETDYFEDNRTLIDWDMDSGKVYYHHCEGIHMAWFPPKALMQVFDNIVSNACEHGFKDKNRQDYIISTEWIVDGFNMIIKISNNGEPLPADLNTDLILEYGYTSAMNQNGHSGIGGGEIAEIMHKFGGSVKIISTPDEQFTVTYELSIPLASIY